MANRGGGVAGQVPHNGPGIQNIFESQLVLNSLHDFYEISHTDAQWHLD